MKISKETELNLLKLGLYQIIGGVIGIAIILWGIYKNAQYSISLIILYSIVVLFFLYSIYSGNLCLKPKSNALRHSLINQILQTVGFTIGVFKFKYLSGLYFTFCIEITNGISFDFGFGISKFILGFASSAKILEIDINLIAIGISFWIISLTKKIKSEIELRTEIDIGNT
ncbi:MAG: hypothetical protein ABI402_09800 [Ferruginibacter sp.]